MNSERPAEMLAFLLSAMKIGRFDVFVLNGNCIKSL